MIALYLSTRNLHFIARFIWRHYLETKWDPHARTREKLKREEDSKTLGSGNTIRDLGKLRKSILIDDDEDFISPEGSPLLSRTHLNATKDPTRAGKFN